MARPSLKEERSEQILDAFEICVVQYGVEGATLEKTAEEAGLARALIRHNVGNRQDLLDSLVGRFLKHSSAGMKSYEELLPETDKAKTLVDWMFDPAYSDTRTVQIASALMTASAHDKALARAMRTWTRTFIKDFAAAIFHDYPNEEEAVVFDVATGITGIYANVEAIDLMGPMTDVRAASRNAAHRLLSTLTR